MRTNTWKLKIASCGAVASAFASFGSGENHARRDREATRAPGYGPSACLAKPDTILAWYRRLIAQNFDGSRRRSYPGRPRIHPKLEALIIRMAQENSSWGYYRIAGALANLGYHVSDQTVGNVLDRHGLAPATKRNQKTTWKEFIRRHRAVMAGIDFFVVEVLTWRGLVTYYILFSIQPGESAGLSGGDHAAPGPRLDGAAGSKCDR